MWYHCLLGLWPFNFYVVKPHPYITVTEFPFLRSLHAIRVIVSLAGVVPCGGPKKSPRTSSIVQIIFRPFEISKGIQSVQNTNV